MEHGIAITLIAAASISTALAGDKTEIKRAQNEVVSAAFDRLDRDENGLLDVGELESAPKLRAHFADADIDRDGTLSREEFTASWQKNKEDAD